MGQKDVYVGKEVIGKINVIKQVLGMICVIKVNGKVMKLQVIGKII